MFVSCIIEILMYKYMYMKPYVYMYVWKYASWCYDEVVVYLNSKCLDLNMQVDVNGNMIIMSLDDFWTTWKVLWILLARICSYVVKLKDVILCKLAICCFMKFLDEGMLSVLLC